MLSRGIGAGAALCSIFLLMSSQVCNAQTANVTTGGLTLHGLNVGASPLDSPSRAVGVVHLSPEPFDAVRKITEHPQGSWVAWNEWMAETPKSEAAGRSYPVQASMTHTMQETGAQLPSTSANPATSNAHGPVAVQPSLRPPFVPPQSCI